MRAYDNYFLRCPSDEKERDAMIAFHKLEQDCDAHNCVQALQIRDEGELKKGQVVKINASMKRWYKETSTAIKRLTPSSRTFIGYSSMGIKRTWLNV